MLNSQGSFTEKEMGVIRFEEIAGHVLERVCQYFYYKLRYSQPGESAAPDFPISSSHALELLMAANFLDCVRSSIFLLLSSGCVCTDARHPDNQLLLFHS